jgi:hypothetical protein
MAATCAGSKPWNASPDAVPLVLNDLPDPGLEDRARQMLEEERGIVRCMVAELLEWQHVGHDRARDGDEHHFGARHGVGDRGRVCALPEFRRQRPRPGGVPCRERDVVAGGVPEPA